MSACIFLAALVAKPFLEAPESARKVLRCGVMKACSHLSACAFTAGSEHERKPIVSRYLPDSMDTARLSTGLYPR